jgi:peptidoglycan hydrolase-like protein with peptidoglycan-binding domain
MGCMGSVVKPHKWLFLKRPWEFVKELFRTYLVSHGSLSNADGVFGTRTEEAIKQFQAQKGLKADGIVGPATRAALRI